ncbi:chitin disaccharide deacetylase [Bacillus sp. 165]|uniref:chitin disaccharide deacetylase n=1 Tax=Bacillus sp. 165 TaxID=1529117 RepID=UPI001ADC3F3A|nr:chitin disaccharide deacetylase [Bacillus sp. 165]MBO9129961.1 chitin disaccharide deacetylase [Bacillus sp. 165]
MKKLIVNADDFGLTRGVNHGIIDAHVNGIVNSTTMMMNMVGTEHAAELAKQHPTLGVGVHLVLTAGQPLHTNVRSLVDENGLFYSNQSLRSRVINEKELEAEWTAQIERFFSYGLTPTHLDSHHHVHTLEQAYPVFCKLAKKYNLPVRRSVIYSDKEVNVFSDQFFVDFYGDGVCKEYFQILQTRVQDGETVEIMCHPAYVDEGLLRCSSYTLKRAEELEILTTSKLPNGFELVRF